jgi:hypothetical protein
MRQLKPASDRATDFRILGAPGEPTILSLIRPLERRYAFIRITGAMLMLTYGRGVSISDPRWNVQREHLEDEGNTKLKVGNPRICAKKLAFGMTAQRVMSNPQSAT